MKTDTTILGYPQISFSLPTEGPLGAAFLKELKKLGRSHSSEWCDDDCTVTIHHRGAHALVIQILERIGSLESKPA